MKIRAHCCIAALAAVFALPTSAVVAGADQQSQPEPDYVNSMRLSNNPGTEPEAVHSRFRQIDANRDGRIDRSEAQASSELAARFDTLDADHDGILTAREFAAIRDIAAIRLDRERKQR